MENQSQTPDRENSGAKRNIFVTGFLVAASALAGGLAVVLWNRKALSRLRQQVESAKAVSREPDDTEE